MLTFTGILRRRPDGRAGALTSRSCRSRQQGAQPYQVVGRRGERHDPIHPFAAAVPQLAQAADGLHPAEDLLDQLPFALTDPIARMPCGAPVDTRASVLLGHVRRNPQLARRRDEPAAPEILVPPNRLAV